MFKKVFTYLLAGFLVAGFVSVGEAQKLPDNRKELGGKVEWRGSQSTTATLTGVASTADTSTAVSIWEMDAYNIGVNTTNVSNGESAILSYQLSTDGEAWTAAAVMDSALAAGTDYNLVGGLAGASETLPAHTALHDYRLMRFIVSQTANAANTDSMQVVIKPFILYKDVQSETGGKIRWRGADSSTLILTGVANTADTSDAVYVFEMDNFNVGVKTTDRNNGEGVILDYQLSTDGVTWTTAAVLDTLDTAGTNYNIVPGQDLNANADATQDVVATTTLHTHRLLRLIARQVTSAADTDSVDVVVKPFSLFIE